MKKLLILVMFISFSFSLFSSTLAELEKQKEDMQLVLDSRVYKLFKKLKKQKKKNIIKVYKSKKLTLNTVASNITLRVVKTVGTIGLYGQRYWTYDWMESVMKTKYLVGNPQPYQYFRKEPRQSSKIDNIYLFSTKLIGKDIKREVTITEPMMVTEYFPKSVYGASGETYALYSIADYNKYYKLLKKISLLKKQSKE